MFHIICGGQYGRPPVSALYLSRVEEGWAGTDRMACGLFPPSACRDTDTYSVQQSSHDGVAYRGGDDIPLIHTLGIRLALKQKSRQMSCFYRSILFVVAHSDRPEGAWCMIPLQYSISS